MAVLGLGVRTEHLTEGRGRSLTITRDEVDELRAIGQRVAGAPGWWGARASPGEEDPAEKIEQAATVIRCDRGDDDRWQVRVDNAVGVLSIPGLQLVIEPKIPLSHLLHLFSRSGRFPRLDDASAELDSAEDLLPLIASWYVSSLESLLQSGLLSSYRGHREEMPIARGRIHSAATTRLLLRGRVAVDCEYEEFDTDTPLNRVLLAATGLVAADPRLSPELRKRARRATHHMEGVGRLQPADLGAPVERHTARYATPHQLATHVIAGTGRTLAEGPAQSRAFLIPTPEMVEEGIRRIVSDALTGITAVEKKSILLKGAAVSLTPDLRFGRPTTHVGDVKYSRSAVIWDRSDLYQLVTFATGFGVTQALRVGFSEAGMPPGEVNVGDVTLKGRDWPSTPGLDPLEAEAILIEGIRSWWEEVKPQAGAG